MHHTEFTKIATLRAAFIDPRDSTCVLKASHFTVQNAAAADRGCKAQSVQIAAHSMAYVRYVLHLYINR